MAQKTFSEYITRKIRGGQLPPEPTREEEKRYGQAALKAEKLREKWNVASSQEPYTEARAAKADRLWRQYATARERRDAVDTAYSRRRSQYESAAEALAPQGRMTTTRYVTTPYAGRRPTPAACRRIFVEVVASPGIARSVAKLEDGTVIGQIKAETNSHRLAVKLSSMVEGGRSLDPYGQATDYSGCGIGTRLYEALAQYACRNKLEMVSDRTLFAPSKAFWQKQVRKGRAKWVPDDGRYVLINACASARNLSGLKKARKRRKG